MATEPVRFAPVGEKEITKALVNEWHENFQQHIDTDVVIVGGGPSGLVAARDLALAGAKVVVVESNNYLGGGFWVGGFMMAPLTVRAPAQAVLDELGISYKAAPGVDGLYLTTGPEACSKAIAAACDAGVWFQNVTNMEDIVLREDPEEPNGKPRVAGAVVNWSPVQSLPRQITCLDPVALEAKVVIDATGHDAACLSKLRDMGLVEVPGHGSMWIERSEDLVGPFVEQGPDHVHDGVGEVLGPDRPAGRGYHLVAFEGEVLELGASQNV